ncbi:MAG: sugar phosphate isomerase/epimerase family protein [Leptothrix sp. (in: b-proteobacteria)]
MRIAYSNIAWDVAEDDAVAALLIRHGIDAIDIAPGKYFPDLDHTTPEDAERVSSTWAARGIEITGMQALLFGTTRLNLFGSADVQEAMLRRLTAVCRVAGWLGAPRLVFGAPKNRDRSGLDQARTLTIATDFFRRLGDVAAAHGVLICLEPNPDCYGCNFMTDTDETAAMVRRVAHPHVRMQLDTGAIAINHEDIDALLRDHAELVGHVHLSEPDLLPLGDGSCDHAAASVAIARYLPDHLVSIEMRPTDGEPHPDSMARAIAVALRYYRGSRDAS